MSRVLSFLFLVFLIGCNKETATEVNPLFSGTWHHYKSFEVYKYLVINPDGNGYIFTSDGYNDNAPLNSSKTHTWFAQGNSLALGRFPADWETFAIDSFPKVVTSNFSVDYTYAYIDNKYMWLDGFLFVSDD